MKLVAAILLVAVTASAADDAPRAIEARKGLLYGVDGEVYDVGPGSYLPFPRDVHEAKRTVKCEAELRAYRRNPDPVAVTAAITSLAGLATAVVYLIANGQAKK